MKLVFILAVALKYLIATRRKADATVELLTVSGTFNCKTEVRFTCKITDYQLAMTWLVNNIRIGECVFYQCYYYPPPGKNFSFSSNTTAGLFYLVIGNITLEENGDMISCADGSSSSVLTVTVTAPVVDGDIVKIPIVSGKYTKPGIRTSCVYPAQNVTIAWYSIKQSGNVQVYYQEVSTNMTLCLNSTQCILANNSAYFDSVLMKDNLVAAGKGQSTSNQEEQTFYAEIKSDLWNYTFDVGNFIIEDTLNTTCDNTTSSNSAINCNTNKQQSAAAKEEHRVIVLVVGIGSGCGIVIICVVAMYLYCTKVRTKVSVT